MKYFLFLTLFFTTRATFASSDPPPALTEVTVEFEWETVPGAKKYQVEVQTLQKKVFKKLDSNTTQFEVSLPPNKYYVRGRALDFRGAYSQWSPVSEFIVPPKEVTLKEEPQKIIPANRSTFKGTLDLKWADSAGAVSYRIEIQNLDNQKIIKKNLMTTHFTQELPPGRYSYKIVAISGSGIETDGLLSSEPIVIERIEVAAPSELKLHEEILSWKNDLNLSSEIKIYYRRFLGKWKLIDKKSEVTNSLNLKSIKELKPGEYRVLLHFVSPLGERSESAELFWIQKPKEAELKFTDGIE
ncbi:MAG: hypothetical protein ACLGGX_11160 [Bdellovibrionia bacterium]